MELFLNEVKMVKSSIITVLFLSVFLNTTKAQVFWSEVFDNNCAANCKPDTYNGPNGKWTVMTPTTTTEGPDANDWFISYSEETQPVGNCQHDNPTKNSCLHIGPKLDANGATYTTGATAKTDKRAMSPTIDCSSRSSIKLAFDFISTADVADMFPLDHCDLEYSADNGTTWTLLSAKLRAYNCNDPIVMWRLMEIQLPPSADNNPTVKIAFRWVNEESGGYPVSFAVDNIRLSVETALSTGTIPGAPFCACSAIRVPYSSSGILFINGNVFTAQLS
ncbi:MAG TPA: hypothetical protein VLB84_20105, partial [Bacteroidia bacterium]|nr:hypothetical protein [Bacteroidia bacterium]